MADKKDDKSSDSSSGDDLNWKDSARSAHQRDERAQTRDIDRLSDSSPDEAEKSLGDAEAEARRMRTRNET